MATTYEWDSLGTELMNSRSLIAVAEEIRDALDALNGDGERDYLGLEALGCSTGIPEDDEQTAREILAAIEEIESVGIADWQYGETLIRDDYFEDYARELANDIGAVNADAGWPNSFIDWPAAAEALLIDYTEVSYLGLTYYVRA